MYNGKSFEYPNIESNQTSRPVSRPRSLLYPLPLKVAPSPGVGNKLLSVSHA